MDKTYERINNLINRRPEEKYIHKLLGLENSLCVHFKNFLNSTNLKLRKTTKEEEWDYYLTYYHCIDILHCKYLELYPEVEKKWESIIVDTPVESMKIQTALDIARLSLFIYHPILTNKKIECPTTYEWFICHNSSYRPIIRNIILLHELCVLSI
jgi:hypothetical protein